MPPMYATAQPYSWHKIQPVAYVAAPQFRPPTPPPCFVPQNPFLPFEEPPEEDPPPEIEPEPEPPAADEPPPDAGMYLL